MVDLNEEELMNHLAGKISAAIGESGKTKELIAEQADVSKAAVSKWCKHGQIATHNLARLASITGKPISWFFPGEIEVDTESELNQLSTGELEQVLKYKEFLIFLRTA